MEQALWFLLGLGLGLALDFVLVKVMLRSVLERVSVLEQARSRAQEKILEEDK